MSEEHLKEVFFDICYHNSKARIFYIRDLVGFLNNQLVIDLKSLIKTQPKENYELLRLHLEEELEEKIRYWIGETFIRIYEDLEDDTVSLKEIGLLERGAKTTLLAKSLIHDKESLVDKLLEIILEQLKKEPIEKIAEDVKKELIDTLNENLSKLTQQ